MPSYCDDCGKEGEVSGCRNKAWEGVAFLCKACEAKQEAYWKDRPLADSASALRKLYPEQKTENKRVSRGRLAHRKVFRRS